MASIEQHIAQYRHNRRFVATISDQYCDWIVRSTFYTCVHLVDATLAHLDNYHPIDHKTRNKAIANIRQMEFIAKKYDPLYQLCRKIRFFADPQLWVPKQQIASQVFGRLLYPLEQSAFRLLGISNEHSEIVIKPS